MSTKTISLERKAYERLKSLKREDESFTDLVNRLTKKKSLLEISGILSGEEAEALRENVERSSEERKESRKKTLGIG